MKQYILIQVVEAEPMNQKEAFKNKYAREDGDCIGYHLVYEKTHHAWSPANIFEKRAYYIDNEQDVERKIK